MCLAPTRLNDWHGDGQYDLSYLSSSSKQEGGIEQLPWLQVQILPPKTRIQAKNLIIAELLINTYTACRLIIIITTTLKSKLLF